MNNVLRNVVASVAVVAGLFAARADATVVIGGTRIVYPADEKEVTVKLSNEAKIPALVQVWLDDGDEKSTPDSAKVPFTVTPPIFRMDGGKGQAVRLVYTGEPLPTDKESLFWVNVLEVPPKADNKDGRNRLQFAFRTRIKLFFRPVKLAGDVDQAADKLSWKLMPAEAGKELALQVTNPTPYHVNFARVGIDADGKTMEGDGGMVAPGQSTVLPLKGVTHTPSGEIKADFTVITDYGSLVQKQAPLTR
ncbi:MULTISPECIES: molecular chaperone [Ralstonia]|jgi:chaperone protein EcpD|uniref:Fimbrial chaperone YadV n=1 Tax=Ralstonia flaminis TaxID=3058597 RepID=A0ABM9KA36_9RALS|nr:MULTISPECIES: fimbria/pilus periplasmic chaperone [unclassified Ralstonia]CAJ0821220.1 putative fimbrial chaperone YadV [Ralstonia sp. LMG 18101]